MDDLKKQRIKKIDKVVDKVSGDFDEALNRRQLNQLYERKADLEARVDDEERTELNRMISAQQLKDVNESIVELQEKIDLSRELDLEVDEVSAREFVKNNPDVFGGLDDMVRSNDALDKLEEELYGKKNK